VHALHHGGILAGPGDHLVLGGTRAEPTVSLEAETGAESAGLVLDPALNEEVVPENLGHRTVFLKHFTPFPGLLGKAVEEIEGRSVWIHLVWNWKKLPGTQRRDASLSHDFKVTQ
jgi:hypothetical protein